jgi:hypothetical protein
MLGGALAEVERSRDRIAALDARLAWRDEAQITHYPDCWQDHYGCAMERIKALEGERDALLAAKEFEDSHPQGLFSLLTRAYEQRDALKVDAERYRWLRSNRRVGNAKLMMWATGQGRYDDVSQEDAMDAAIDAAKEKP